MHHLEKSNGHKLYKTKYKSPPSLLSAPPEDSNVPWSSLTCVFWCCRSLQCPPELWQPLMSRFRARAPQWARRPKSSLSLLPSSTSSRLTNLSTSLGRLVRVTCCGLITLTMSTRRTLKVLDLPVAALLCCSAAVVLFTQPTLSSLHCLPIQLHLQNFGLYYNICIMLSHYLTTLGIMSILSSLKSGGSSRGLGGSFVH